MKKLIIPLNLQQFAEDGDGAKTKPSENEALLLDKIKKLEERIIEQDRKIASVTEFNRRLLDGAKPATKEEQDSKARFDAFMKEK